MTKVGLNTTAEICTEWPVNGFFRDPLQAIENTDTVLMRSALMRRRRHPAGFL